MCKYSGQKGVRQILKGIVHRAFAPGCRFGPIRRRAACAGQPRPCPAGGKSGSVAAKATDGGKRQQDCVRTPKRRPGISGPPFVRQRVDRGAELLRLSEVDGDGLAVVLPLLFVNLQITRFRIVVEPGCDWKARNPVSGIVGAVQLRQRRILAHIQ